MGRQFLWRLKELQAGLDRVGGLERRTGPPAVGGRRHRVVENCHYSIALTTDVKKKKSESKYDLLVSKDVKNMLM